MKEAPLFISIHIVTIQRWLKPFLLNDTIIFLAIAKYWNGADPIVMLWQEKTN